MPDPNGEALVSLSWDVLESISIAITNYLGQKLPEDDLSTKASTFLSDIIKIGEDLEKKGLRSNETIRSLLEYAKQEEDKLRLNGEARTSELDDLMPVGKDKMSLVDTLMKMLGNAGIASEERLDTPEPEQESSEANERELLPMSSAADLISSHPDDEEDEEILKRIRAERAKKQDSGNENPVEVEEFNEFDKF